MLLSSVFHPEIIKVPLESVEKAEVFEELVDVYVRYDSSADRNTILRALLAREAQGTTGIKKGVALPHARIVGLKRPIGIVGISQQGIHYDSLDGKPVYLVFMLLSNPEKCDEHLRILTSVNSLINDNKFLNDMLEQTTGDAVYNLISKYEVVMLESNF
ncbi:MAG: PTS sugar transporter subunit IIA [Treponema sp.]